PWTIAALGAEGWSVLRNIAPEVAATAAAEIPAAARTTLPALFDRRGLAAIPHLGYRRSGPNSAAFIVKLVEFNPPHPLMAAVFAVV
ncbi:MAG: hypothetical protein ACTSQV_07415, partial [Alphaproteobacteria bacterium]